MKQWWKSKTMWVNLLTFVVASLTALTNGEWVAENPEATSIVAGAVALINIVLRKMTKTEIGKE